MFQDDELTDTIATGTPTPKDAGFHIDNDDSANWYLRKLAGFAAEKALIEAQCKKRVAELAADESRLRGRFDAELEAFGRAKIEALKGRRKSVSLLYGTLAVRTVPASIGVDNVADAIQTARLVCPDALQTVTETRENFDKDALLKKAAELLAATGATLPGLVYNGERESFKVAFPKDKEATT